MTITRTLAVASVLALAGCAAPGYRPTPTPSVSRPAPTVLPSVASHRPPVSSPTRKATSASASPTPSRPTVGALCPRNGLGRTTVAKGGVVVICTHGQAGDDPRWYVKKG